jgi:hypothetical protein
VNVIVFVCKERLARSTAAMPNTYRIVVEMTRLIIGNCYGKSSKTGKERKRNENKRQ